VSAGSSLFSPPPDDVMSSTDAYRSIAKSSAKLPWGLHKVDQLPDNQTSMKVPEVVLPGLSVRAGTFLFLGVLLLPIACVSLDKPPQVAKCAAEKNCSDDFVPPDDKDAAVAPEDGKVADEPTAKADVGPDSATFADTLPGKTDVLGGKTDVWGPEAGAIEVLPPADTRVPTDQPLDPADTRIDTVDAPSGDDVEKLDVIKEDVVKEDVVKEDVIKEDVVKEDLLKADTQGPETSGTSCTIFYGASPSSGSSGHPPGPGTSAEFCVATCDDVMGWGCSNFDSGRKVTVNGTAVNCGDALTKKDGYYVFRVSAGSNPSMKSAGIYWWSANWATSCAPPAGGF
jgi:hypothetical protein